MERNVPEHGSFGEMLQRFRKRAGLNQETLAKRIGGHRSTVSFWERGEYLPETLATVLEIARVLNLQEKDRRLLIEARFGTASVLPIHNLPKRNTYFTGRRELLTNLHQRLQAGKHVALSQTQAISGLGGIGKTQLAIEYAYQFFEYYHDVLWASADSRETLALSYIMLARALQLHEQVESDQQKVVEAMKQWLRDHKGWLLILDNVEDLNLVQEFLPGVQQGSLVLTTQRGETSPIAEALVLDALSEEEGMHFLLKRAGFLPSDAHHDMAALSPHREAGRAIIQALGGLPLALDQAGAYIAECKCSLSHYLALFDQQRLVLLQQRGLVPSNHPVSVATTFSLVLEKVQKTNPTAIELVRCCAFLYPDAIPEELFTTGAAHLGIRLRQLEHDPFALDEAVRVLRSYSLIHRNTNMATLSLHRLVQAVLLDALSEKSRRQWQTRIVQALATIFPDRPDHEMEKCERLLPQTLVAVSWIEHKVKPTPAAARLLRQTGIYLRLCGRYIDAEPFLIQAHTIYERQLGPTHPDTAQSLNGLAILYWQQGKDAQAQPLFQRALAIREQQLGPTHPDTAQSLNGLAILYWQQGKDAQAQPLFQRALAIREQQLGPTHPDTAQSLHNLALFYWQQGEYAQAEPLSQRALTIREQQLGAQHSDTAISLHNLADIYRDQGKGEQAEQLYQRALAIWEQRLGPSHPETAFAIHGLATLFRDQGKSEQAAMLFRRSLAIREDALVSTHPDLADTLHEFAILRQAQGLYDEAQSLYERALSARNQTLGATHFDTIDTRERLIALLHSIGNTQAAERIKELQIEQEKTKRNQLEVE